VDVGCSNPRSGRAHRLILARPARDPHICIRVPDVEAALARCRAWLVDTLPRRAPAVTASLVREGDGQHPARATE
jgi:hypothetical protein